MRYLKAVLAAIVLVALMAGVPAGLITGYGNPTHGLTQGLVTDTTILDVVVVITWALWLQMTTCFVLEAINQVRGRRGSDELISLPAIGLQADLARVLVGAILAVGLVGTSTVVGSSRADALAAARPTIAASQAAAVASDVTAPQGPKLESTASASAVEVTVQPGDSLWRLAEIHLGDGAWWRTIADLNHGRNLGNGVIATTALLQDGLQPGWRLVIPAATLTHHMVEPGENLSEIAARSTGNATNWPQIYTVNRTVIGGNPNLIRPGEDLTIPMVHSESRTHDGEPVRKRHDADAGVVDTPAGGAGRDAPLDGSPASPRASRAATSDPNTSRHGASDGSASASEMAAVAPWLVGSLLLTGGVLAGTLHLRLSERRRDRFRARRPGRTIGAPEPVLLPLAKTVAFVGAPIAETLTLLDLELRRLGHTQNQAGARLPALAAIELTATDVVLHLTEQTTLDAPWERIDSEGLRWRTPITAASVEGEGWDWPAPYPLLATLGHDEDGHWWLLNLEQLGVLTINGDHRKGEDLVRYLAAELAVANWARDARIDLVGIGAELTDIDSRLRIHTPAAVDETTTAALTHAQAMIERSTEAATDTATARAGQPDDEVWDAHLIILTAHDADAAATGILSGLISTHPGRTATAILQAGEEPPADHQGVALSIDGDGNVTIDVVGLRLIASQLPAEDAEGIAALYRQARDLTDAPVPVDEDAADGETAAYTDASGNLRQEHVLARDAASVDVDSVTLLEAAHEVYLDTAAVVEEDLQALSPRVPLAVSKALGSAGPYLEEDLEEWKNHGERRPRLRLLGAVKAFAYGDNIGEIGQRIGFYTELLAFLWAHSKHGATMNDLLEAFPTLSPPRVRADIATLREWLGTNPRTGKPILPPATQAPARAHHGRNVYQVDRGPGGLLVDVDLLRRLRLASQAQGGEAGIARTLQALVDLVDGQPFSDLRDNGWSWLLEGDRIDEQMVVAVADMAHLATTHYLAAGDLDNARLTADIGLLAAPYEETTRLDMVAVKEADGATVEAADLLNTGVLNRSDDGRAPLDACDRTRRIVNQRGWTQAV